MRTERLGAHKARKAQAYRARSSAYSQLVNYNTVSVDVGIFGCTQSIIWASDAQAQRQRIRPSSGGFVDDTVFLGPMRDWPVPPSSGYTCADVVNSIISLA